MKQRLRHFLSAGLGFFFTAILTLLGGYLLKYQTIAAGPVYSEGNLRELCRRSIAGIYLESYDNRQRAVGYTSILNGKLDRLKKVASDFRKESNTANKKAEDSAFDVNLAARSTTLIQKANAIDAQIDEAQMLLDKAKKEAETYTKEESDIRGAISPIFKIVKEPTGNGAYPFRIEYKSECPPYNYLCTLPPKEAEQLKTLLGKDKTPEPCQRYATLKV